MKFTRLVVGPLETNCYILWDPDSKCSAVIDPGGEAARIREELLSSGLAPQKILLTHGHPDHTFAAGELSSSLGIPVLMHEADTVFLSGPLDIAAYYYDMSEYLPFVPGSYLQDGQDIFIGSSPVRVIHTPGHSQGGVCFLTDAGLFCGDTVFAGSVGRTDLPGGDFDTLIESVRSKILTADDSVRLFPGHGPYSTVGNERRNNPFLR